MPEHLHMLHRTIADRARECNAISLESFQIYPERFPQEVFFDLSIVPNSFAFRNAG